MHASPDGVEHGRIAHCVISRDDWICLPSDNLSEMVGLQSENIPPVDDRQRFRRLPLAAQLDFGLLRMRLPRTGCQNCPICTNDFGRNTPHAADGHIELRHDARREMQPCCQALVDARVFAQVPDSRDVVRLFPGNHTTEVDAVAAHIVEPASPQCRVKANVVGIAKAIDVKIPKGLIQGKKIRLAGKGEMSPNGGPAGNLYIKSNPIPSNGYVIEGNDVLFSKQILLTQALLGDTIEVVTPDGTAINLKLPAGTNHRSKMRIPKHGIPQMKGNGCGDLFVVINIAMPKELTTKQKELIQQLEKTGL